MVGRGAAHWAWTFTLALLGRGCSAMLASGSTLVVANGASLISKFCFTFNPKLGDETAGKLAVTTWVPDFAEGQHLELLLFDDETGSYPGFPAAWSEMTCEEKRQRAKTSRKLLRAEAAEPEGQAAFFRIIEKLRPRWWYIAVMDCSNSSVTASFQVHATNPGYGWASEFSTDKRHTLWVFTVCVAVYASLATLQSRANSVLAEMVCSDSASSKAAHPFARILLAGILLGLGACVLAVIHAVWYAHDGIARPALHVAVQVLRVSSSFVLASLLLLVSEGKCISYVMVAGDAWRMLRVLGPFAASRLLLELWGEYSVSQRYSVDSVYTTAYGWALILVDLVLLGAYAANLKRTYAAERDRGDGAFYRRWGSAYGVWFLALPVTAVLSQAALAPYVWHIVSLVVVEFTTFLAYAALVVGLWPGNSQTHFKLFMPAEGLLEDCVTPPNRRAWGARAVLRFHAEGLPRAGYAGCYDDHAGLRPPTLLEAMKQARASLHDAARGKL